MGLSSDLQIGNCNLITCADVIAQYLEIGVFELWVRLLGAIEDIKPTVDFVNGKMDLSILSLAQLPVTSVAPTALKFSKKRKFGTVVTLSVLAQFCVLGTMTLSYYCMITTSISLWFLPFLYMDKVSVCFVVVIG